MSDRLYFSVPDECDNMLAQRFLRDKCGLSARMIIWTSMFTCGFCRASL